MRFTLPILVLLVVAACGGEDPKLLCRNLRTAICVRAEQCAMLSQADCTPTVNQLLVCENAKDVSEQYDGCQEDVTLRACSGLFPNNMLQLPVRCQGAVLF